MTQSDSDTSRLRKIMARNNFTFMISISVLFVLFVLTVAHKPVTTDLQTTHAIQFLTILAILRSK
jgi:hypothetical protein